MPEGFGAFGSDFGGFGRTDVLAPYKPTPYEVAAEQRGQQEGTQNDSLFATALKAPSRLFGAESIRGAIAGYATGGVEGALEGAAHGYGWLTDLVGLTDHAQHDTSFADIRKAFGNTQQSGAADFIINLAGDILTDPSSFVTIFGKVGTAATTGITQYASIAKSLEIGERAFLKFKYPFLPAIGMGFPIADPLLKTMGFNSLSLNLAKGIDRIASAVRVGPIGSMLSAFTTNLPPIADPEAARAWVAAKNALKETPQALESSWLQVWAQTPRDAQEYVLQSPSAQRVLREMRERGLTSFDQEHTLREILGRPAEVLTPASAVQEAGRVAGVGDIRSPAQKAFESGVASAGQKQAQVIESAREGLLGDLDSVMARLKDDPTLKTALDGHLVRSADFMRKLGDKELAEGLINSQLEFYVPRDINPAARDLINSRVGTLLPDDFAQGRKFSDLTTIEANAVVRKIGTKLTGYQPLEDIAKQAEQEAGWFAQIFDKPFLKQLRKVDPDAADLFSVNPIFADFLRVRRSGIKLGQQEFWKQAISAVSKGSVAAKDLAAKADEVAQYTGQGLIPVVVAQGKKVEFPNLANFAEEQLGYDVRARYVAHRSRLGAEVDNVLGGEKANLDYTLDQLHTARDLPNAETADFAIKDADDYATVQMKTALAEERNAAEARQVLQDARKGLLGYGPAETPPLPFVEQGSLIRPRRGYLYRSFDDINDMRPSPFRPGSGYRNDLPSSHPINNEIKWNPKGKAASEGFQWANLDRGFVVEFPAGAEAGVVEGGAYKNLSKEAWSTPTGKTGQPSRIFYGVDSPPAEFESLRKRFPNTQFIGVKDDWTDALGNMVTSEDENAFKAVSVHAFTGLHDRSGAALAAYEQAAANADRRIAAAGASAAERTRLANQIADLDAEAKFLNKSLKDAEQQATAAGREFDAASKGADLNPAAADQAAERSAAADRFAAQHRQAVEARLADIAEQRAAAVSDHAEWSSLKDDLALARNPNARKRLIDAELRDLSAEASDRLTRARTNRLSVQQAIADQINDLKGDYRQFADSISTDASRAKTVLQAMKDDGTHGQKAAAAIFAQRSAAKDGMIEFNALTQAQKDALTRRAPDALIHFVDPADKVAATSYFNDLTKADPLRKYSLIRNLDAATGVWKAWTVGNVMFLNARVRDFVVGLAMLGFGRGGVVKGSAVVDAMAASKAFRTVMGGGGTLEDVGSKVLFKGVPAEFDNASKVLSYLADHGQIDSGLVRDEILQSSSDAVKMVGHTRVTDFFSKNAFRIDPKSNPFTRAGYEVANFGDNWVKIAGFLDGLKRGETPEAALDFVRKWTYNPLRDATSFTRFGLRRAVPFGQFATWAIQRSAEQLFTQPGTIGWIQKMQDNAARVPPLGGDPIDKGFNTILPDFIKDGLGVPYKNTPTGPRYFLFGGYLPAAELGKLATAIEGVGGGNESADKAGPLYRYIVSQLNPFAKLAIEEAVNRDSFTGAEIKAYEGQSREMFGAAVPARWYQLFRQVRILSELDKLNVINLPQAKVMIDAVDRGATLGDREQLPAVERYLTSAFGVAPRSYQVDVAEQVREARREAANRVGEMEARLRNTVQRAPEGPKRSQNIEALRQELLQAAVDSKSVEDLAREYQVPRTIQRKASATLAFPRLGR